GQTNKLVETDLAAILTELRTLGINLGAGTASSVHFHIWTTNVFDAAGVPDFSSKTVDALPPTLNDKYELAFKIVATNDRGNKFFLTTAAKPIVESPVVKWDTTTAAATILKYVLVTKSSLSAVVLTGNTKSIAITVNPSLVLTKDRVVTGNVVGKLAGLKVLYKITATGATINNHAMPEEVFKEYLAGRIQMSGSTFTLASGTDVTSFGFTAANYEIAHDGTWDWSDIRVGYEANPGFVIDAPQGVVDIIPTVANLNQFIDIKPLLDKKDLLKLVVKTTADSTYIDSQNLQWVIDPLLLSPLKLNGELLWAVSTTAPAAGDSAWKRNAPTVVPDDSRHVWVMFSPTGTDKARIHLSDGTTLSGATSAYTPKPYDISAQVHLNDKSIVPTNVAIAGMTLNNIDISGETNKIVIDDSDAKTGRVGNNKDHAHIEYSVDGNIWYTKQAFILYVNGDGTAGNPYHNIKRNSILTKLVAETGFSMTPTDEPKTHSGVKHANLYSFVDVAAYASKLQFKPGGVAISGVVSRPDGIVVSLPMEFAPAALAALGLELQYTTDAKASNPQFVKGGDYKTQHVKDRATWLKANLGATAKTAVLPATTNGMVITLGMTKGYASLAFRLVPIKNDEMVNSGLSPSNTYQEHVEGSRVRPSDLVNAPTTLTNNGPVYLIDTSSIPTLVYTTQANLQHIELLGDTRHITIHEDMNGAATGGDKMIDTIASSFAAAGTGKTFDPTTKDEVEVRYSIDTNAAGVKIFLNKEDFTAYLNGKLEVVGGRVVYKNNHSKEVTLLSTAGTAGVPRSVPDYLAINIADIRVKWASKTPAFQPSEKGEETPVMKAGSAKATSFRKWFDPVQFKTEINLSKVTGDTHAYTISANGVLTPQFLAKHHLKIQYSNSKNTGWADTKFDYETFSSGKARWDVKVGRVLWMRVVPQDDTQTIVGDGVGSAEAKPITTTTDAANIRAFKVYIDVNKAQMNVILARGTTHELWGHLSSSDPLGTSVLGLTESVVETQFDYSFVRVEYRYGFESDGVTAKWYTKADLYAAMASDRLSNTNPPSNFTKGNILSRFVVNDTKDSVIKAGQDAEVHINTDGIANWINIDSIQLRPSAITDLFTATTDALTTSATAGITTPSWTLSGDKSKASLVFAAAGLIKEPGTGSAIDTLKHLHMKIQWSVQVAPSMETDSTDWHDGWPGTPDTAPIDPTLGNLWIRFIPESDVYALSTSFKNPNVHLTTDPSNRMVTPIKVDTSELRYSVHLDKATLANLLISGNTQKLSFDETAPLTNGYTNADKVDPLDHDYDSSNPTKTKGQRDKAKAYAKIEYKVKNTRIDQTVHFVDAWIRDMSDASQTNYVHIVNADYNFVQGTEYSFAYKEDLTKAVNTGGINFIVSEIKVRWGVKDESKNTASDRQWVSPNVTSLKGFVYTTDYTTLAADSYTLTGNTNKVVTAIQDIKLDPAKLTPLGLKVQWISSVDDLASAKTAADTEWKDWDGVTALAEMPDKRNVFIRFVPIDDNKFIVNGVQGNSMDAPTYDGEQIVKLDTSKTKIAIALDTAFKNNFAAQTVSGNTRLKDATTNPGGLTIDGFQDLASHITTDNNAVNFRYQYSLGHMDPNDSTKWIDEWKDTLSEAMLDHYGKGKAVDKDRDLEGLRMRIIVNDDVNYVITIDDGTEWTDIEALKQLDITPLIQDVYTDVSVEGLDPLNGPTTFATWFHDGQFKGAFKKGSTSKFAVFNNFQFKGQDIDVTDHADPESIFRLNQNPYYLGDATKYTTRAERFNQMALRHTYFKFSTSTDGINWGSWSKNSPTGELPTSTTYKGMRVQLVAMPGYSLPAAPALGPNPYIKEFNVVLEANTQDVNIGSITYVGFNVAAGEGRVATDGVLGDPNKGKPSIIFNDPSGNPLTSLFSQGQYTVEYKVTDAAGNANVNWEDSSGKKGAGWHSFNATDTPPDPANWDAQYQEFGHPPIKLKNNQKVVVRLRANDGWVIIDSGSLSNDLTTGYATYSHDMDSGLITTLKEKITIPAAYRVFVHDPKFNYAAGSTASASSIATIDPTMPSLTFNGNDGQGTVSANMGTNPIGRKMGMKFQILRPWRPSSKPFADLIDTKLMARFGYTVQLKDGTTKVVYATTAGHIADGNKKLGWAYDISTIANSWFDAADITDLHVGDSLRIKFVAKTGFAFQWEDDRMKFTEAATRGTTPIAKYIDAWSPKTDSKRNFNENVADEASQNVIVNGLKIFPPTDASKITLNYEATTGLVGSVTYHYTKPYNGLAVPVPSIKPTPQAKWKWEYKRDGGIWSSIPMTNLRNGDKIWVRVAPKYATGYDFDPAYVLLNKPKMFVISGLLDQIQSRTVAQPVFSFEGYLGAGNIKRSSFVTSRIQSGEQAFDGTDISKLPQPVSTDPVGGGLTWEFQVAPQNPETMSKREISLLPWTKTAPHTLTVGEYVRARVATVLSSESIEPPKYSRRGGTGPKPEVQWIKVENLLLVPKDIGFESKISGFQGKTYISGAFTKNTNSERGVEMLASIDSGATWVKFDDPKLNTLRRGNTIQFIAVPKKGYKLNPTDDGVVALIGTLPASFGTHTHVIQLAAWKTTVGSLPLYLNVDGVNMKNVLLVKNPFASISEKAVNSGQATIAPEGFAGTKADLDNALDKWVTNQGSITDINNQPINDAVKIQFTLQKFDPDSGSYSIGNPTDKVPVGLANYDRVKVELVPTNPAYKLSSEHSVWVTVKGLIEIAPPLQGAPELNFPGQPGTGSVDVTPEANKGFKWLYRVVKPGQDPATAKYSDKVPGTLSNGDKVSVKLASAIAGTTIADDYETALVTVTGLFFAIDLSKLEFNQPTYVHINGEQDGGAEV
ncbi:MAG: hypothetical protein KAG91_00090, partial [Mycoplasmataceae bacterium]|nr:hypothetical protein [Mycoplasmataceae bacterium]